MFNGKSNIISVIHTGPSTRIPVFLNPQLFPSGFKNFPVRSVFKSNSPVYTHLEKLGLRVVPPYWFIGLLFGKRLDTILLRHRIRKYPDVIRFVANLCFFFHSGERIQKHPGSLPNSPDACGRKPYSERKSIGFKIIRIRVDGSLMT